MRVGTSRSSTKCSRAASSSGGEGRCGFEDNSAVSETEAGSLVLLRICSLVRTDGGYSLSVVTPMLSQKVTKSHFDKTHRERSNVVHKK